MKILFTLLLCSFFYTAKTQKLINGSVMDKKGNPVTGANIFFEGSYDGVISGGEGNFSLITELTGNQLLIVSYIGFQRFSTEVNLDETVNNLSVILIEEFSELNEVVITAGVFNASDKKKSATMNSFDIATTPSAMGDIYGAFATMPGSQKVGEEGMLFVRGGESYETKTFMDGMLVKSPYFSKTPDIPTRGRYSPLLFSETTFSTGGYSAEYGQAISSVVDLTTNGLETDDKTSLAIMTVGGTASIGKKFKNSSLAVSGMYVNSALQNRLFKQNIEWIDNPVLADESIMYRKIVGKSGMLKVFSSYSTSSMKMNFENFEQGSIEILKVSDHKIYNNAVYTDQINEKWLLRAGIAGSQDLESMEYSNNPVKTNNYATQAKLVLTRLVSENIKFRIGSDILVDKYNQEIVMDTSFRFQISDIQPSAFAESDFKLSRIIALRLGARSEFSSLVQKHHASPRISAACKTGTFSQLSLAWGLFSQKPGNDYLKFAPTLSEENAAHYILNFQHKKDKRILRMELYAKKYSGLVKYSELYSIDPLNYNNNGTGYAKGLDVFWRDQKSLKNTDYWISYSFLDTKRNYKDYPVMVEPSYSSRHNLSIVYKYLCLPLKTFVAVNYTFASGRPYDDKNSEKFMDGRTKSFNDISLNLTHITRIVGKDAVIHLSLTNLAGFNNVYGYRYSDQVGGDGIYASKPVTPTTGRQAVLMVLISL